MTVRAFSMLDEMGIEKCFGGKYCALGSFPERLERLPLTWPLKS